MIILPKIEPPTDSLMRLAFYGPMCSGKTYLATKLRDTGYTKLAFADRLKDVARELYQVEGKDGPARTFLQEFGDVTRSLDPNVWIYPVLKEVEAHPLFNFVIDDLRTLTEAVALKDAGFTLIRVETQEKIRLARIKVLYPNTEAQSLVHSTELEWNYIPADEFVYSNNNTDVNDLLGWIYGS